MSAPASATTVDSVMHRGVIDCAPQATLGDVAELMVANSVHCVVVDGLARGPHRSEQLVWGIVSDVDLMRAAGAGGLGEEAGQSAATEIVTVESDADVEQAARIMGEHECSHLIVTSPEGRPLGVISSLDVARALAGAR